MSIESPSLEILVCAGAFASVLAFKYILSRGKSHTEEPSSKSAVRRKTTQAALLRSSALTEHEKNKSFSGSLYSAASAEERKKVSGSKSSGTSEYRHVIGLNNLGNTCYLNSVLQAIVCLPRFVNWIRNFRSSVCSPTQPQTNSSVWDPPAPRRNFPKHDLTKAERRTRYFFHSLNRVVDVLNHNTGIDIDCYSATSLINSMFDGAKGGTQFFQQDPDELFLFMNNLISQSWTEHRFSVFNRDMFTSERIAVNDIIQNQKIFINHPKPHLEEIIPVNLRRPWMSQPFQGLLYQDLLCVCCRKSRIHPLEVFNTLSLTLPANTYRNEVFLLEYLLKKYFVPADLDDVECPHCPSDQSLRKHPLTPHLKRCAIARMPKVLCLHIRRAMWDGSDSWKRKDLVGFPSTLSMSEFSWIRHFSTDDGKAAVNHRNGLSKSTNIFVSPINSQPSDQRAAVYQLKSVIVHVGDLSSRGHIVAYRKGPIGSRNVDCWYYTSDNVVRQTTWAEVESANPYILFYELHN